MFRRLTDTCSRKISVAPIGPDDDFATATGVHVSETLGLTIELDEIAGVWEFRLRTEDGEQTPPWVFVIFDASSASGNNDLTATPPRKPAGSTHPADADDIPGTELFLD